MKPDDFADVIVTTIKRALMGPLVAGRLDALEKQLAELKATPSLKFQGTYQDPAQYSPGDAVTRQGSLWACTSATTGEFDHECWVLCVKKGSAQ